MILANKYTVSLNPISPFSGLSLPLQEYLFSRISVLNSSDPMEPVAALGVDPTIQLPRRRRFTFPQRSTLIKRKKERLPEVAYNATAPQRAKPFLLLPLAPHGLQLGRLRR